MKIRILGLILLVLSLFIIQKETYIVTSPFEYPVRTGLVICYLATAVALFFKAKWFWIWGIFSFTIWGHSLLLQFVYEIIAISSRLGSLDKPNVGYVAFGMLVAFTAIYFSICAFALRVLWNKEIRKSFPVTQFSRYAVSLLSMVYAVSFVIYASQYEISFINMILFLAFGVYVLKPNLLGRLNYEI